MCQKRPKSFVPYGCVGAWARAAGATSPTSAASAAMTQGTRPTSPPYRRRRASGAGGARLVAELGRDAHRAQDRVGVLDAGGVAHGGGEPRRRAQGGVAVEERDAAAGRAQVDGAAAVADRDA